MSHEHDQWLDLILVYEHLDEPERERADAHLADCTGCANLLKRLQDAEGARLEGSLLFEPLVPLVLEGPERTEAESSLEALRERLGFQGGEPSRPFPVGSPSAGAAPHGEARFHRLIGGWPRVLIPAALAAGLFLLLFTPRLKSPSIQDLAVVRPSEERGIRQPGAQAWKTGEPFALQFRLTRPGFVYVLHVDPAGEVEVLYPGALEARGTLVAAGETMRIPDAGGPEEWVLEGEPGIETFLIAASSKEKAPLDALLEEIAARVENVRDREGRIKAVQRVLEKRLGSVQSTSVDHSLD